MAPVCPASSIDLGTSSVWRVRPAGVGPRVPSVGSRSPVVTEAASSLVATSSELTTRVGVVYLVDVLKAFLILDGAIRTAAVRGEAMLVARVAVRILE